MRDGGADDSGARSILLEEGTLLAGKYRLRRTAGFGGMAQLWVATNEATGAEVCVKILVPAQSDEEGVERFRREAYAAARLSHRAIVRIFDLMELGPTGATTSGGKPAALAIVMELLHGETLGDYLMKKGKLPLDETIDLALPFVSALAHAHRAGVVHRDLKPDNIFLASDPDGHVIPKVLDFGVSKLATTEAERLGTAVESKPLTMDGMMLGTPSFMSPEQARGARDVDARSDVFSAGILVYMMLSGKNPFECESFHSVISAILQREAPKLSFLPDEIWAVIEKALEKDPKARFADATELGIALRRASGRTSTTESGPQSLTAVPASAKTVVAPLGGDSIVTVPPVGNAELGDTAGESLARAEVPTARRRAVRIVAAVLGVSLAILIAALLRSPADSAKTSGAGETSARPSATPQVAPPVTATATATATLAPPATATLAPTPTPTARIAPTPIAAPPIAADAGATTKVPQHRPPEKKVNPAAGGEHKEPSIVRDPGF